MPRKKKVKGNGAAAPPPDVKTQLNDAIVELQARLDLENMKEKWRRELRQFLAKRQLVRRDVLQIARELPSYISVADIRKSIEAGVSVGHRGKFPPKYANPENPEKTWSGVGKSPEWFKAYVTKRGQKKEDLLIEK